ncbi:MAG: MerR family transcriptional regulator [Xanthobacteraceae bacterium]
MLTFDEINEIAKKARAAAEAFPLISIQKVAKQYGVSLRTLRRWQAGGLMPPRTKHGRWLKYQKEAIAELMAARGVTRCDLR